MNSAKLHVRFFATDSGTEPVREWLLSLTPKERKTIGEDIKTVQYGWPLGMPLVRKMETDLWEVRVHLVNKIARVLFTVTESKVILLLHGFIQLRPILIHKQAPSCCSSHRFFLCAVIIV